MVERGHGAAGESTEANETRGLDAAGPRESSQAGDRPPVVADARVRQPRTSTVALALLIAILLYGALYLFAERLTHNYGSRNPFYKIATAPVGRESLLILGASRGLPLTYGDMNEVLEARLGTPVLNLSAPGAGVVPNYLLLDYFIAKHGQDAARLVVYVLDSFALSSAEWNEDRLSDSRLWQRAPLDLRLARALWGATQHLDVPRSVFWNYVSAFSKLNDPATWFEPDVWPDEHKFENAYSANRFQDQARIAFLYPEPVQPELLVRYETLFAELTEELDSLGVPLIVIAPPLRDEFISMIPNQADFTERTSALLEGLGVPFYDLTETGFENSLFLDPDHLNRAGVTHLLDLALEEIIESHLAPSR